MMYSGSSSYEKLSNLCASIGCPLSPYPTQTAIERAKGQANLLKAISLGKALEGNDKVDKSFVEKDAFSKFDKFTKHAREALSLAQEEARRFQHNYIGTEHLLLGLIHEDEYIAAKALHNLGIEPNKVRRTIEFIIGRGDRIVLGEIGLTLGAKRVIKLAVDEARRLNHHFIGTEHLLLGLIREGEGIGASVLENSGVTLENVRTEVLVLLRSSDMGKDAFSKDDRFTKQARQALSLAQAEARRFQHNYIGTEHLLLGLVREGEGEGESVAAKVLSNLGAELNKVRSAVEFIIGRGDRIVLGEVGLTPRAKKVIELATDEACCLNHSYIGTEHLLLGLVREGEGIGAGVLGELGVTLENVRTEILVLLRSSDRTQNG